MKRYIGFLFLFVGLLTFQSCLYDKPVEEGEYGFTPESLETKKIIEFKGMYPQLSKETNVRVDGISVLTDEPVKKVTLGVVHLSAASGVADEDITVQVKLSHDAVTGEKFPLDALKLDPVVIKAGKSDAEITAELRTDVVTVEGSALRMDLSVAQSGYTVSGNFSQMVLTIKVRSKYEGTYRYEMLSQNSFGSDIAGAVNNGAEDFYMSTVTPVSVICEPFYGVWGDLMIITFDPETDRPVSVQFPDWDIWSLVEEESSYDPATKTFIISITPNGSSHVVLRLTRLD